MIYHIVAVDYWNASEALADYTSHDFDEEGFIHATGEPGQLVEVAERYYKGTPDDYLILVVNEKALSSEVRWELAHGAEFPHVYGAINHAAIEDVIPFPRTEDGGFRLPRELGGTATKAD